MPWSTDATFGAVSAIRRLISSTPFTTYLSWHGDPVGEVLKQSFASDEKPMSLPPMPSVTSVVSAASASNCGGFGPGDTPCVAVMSPVSAPLQPGARRAGPRCGAAGGAELWGGLGQPPRMGCSGGA